jgi:hypothetical protein
MAVYVAPTQPYVAPAPMVLYEKVTFETNILFDSDKSALRPAAGQARRLRQKIHGLDSQSIVAVGYADRMGTDADNQTLPPARRRREELPGRPGIAWDRVQTTAGRIAPDHVRECKDANNAKNVACMQPDRTSSSKCREPGASTSSRQSGPARAGFFEKGNGMLYTIAVYSSSCGSWARLLLHRGGFIHVLLVIAVVMILLRVISGRRPV